MKSPSLYKSQSLKNYFDYSDYSDGLKTENLIYSSFDDFYLEVKFGFVICWRCSRNQRNTDWQNSDYVEVLKSLDSPNYVALPVILCFIYDWHGGVTHNIRVSPITSHHFSYTQWDITSLSTSLLRGNDWQTEKINLIWKIMDLGKNCQT